MFLKVQEIRQDFPIFQNTDLVYLDNAATTQIPRVVMDKMNDYYTSFKANVGRSSGMIATLATENVEKVRAKIHKLLNSTQDSGQVIFTSGTTESLNLVALSLYKYFKKMEIADFAKISKNNSTLKTNFDNQFQSNYQVIISQIEHHSNFLVWMEYFETRFWELEKAQNNSRECFGEKNIEAKLSKNNLNNPKNSQNVATSDEFCQEVDLPKNSLKNLNLPKIKTKSQFEPKLQTKIVATKFLSFKTAKEILETENLANSKIPNKTEKANHKPENTPKTWNYLDSQKEIEENEAQTWQLSFANLAKLVNSQTKILAISHCSNLTGQILQIKAIIKKIRAISPDICVVVDGSQAVAHTKIDVADLDCDFYVFGAHKMFGPSGIGVIWGKNKWLQVLEPAKFGGGMVQTVNWKSSNQSGNLETLEQIFKDEHLEILKSDKKTFKISQNSEQNNSIIKKRKWKMESPEIVNYLATKTLEKIKNYNFSYLELQNTETLQILEIKKNTQDLEYKTKIDKNRNNFVTKNQIQSIKIQIGKLETNNPQTENIGKKSQIENGKTKKMLWEIKHWSDIINSKKLQTQNNNQVECGNVKNIKKILCLLQNNKTQKLENVLLKKIPKSSKILNSKKKSKILNEQNDKIQSYQLEQKSLAKLGINSRKIFENWQNLGKISQDSDLITHLKSQKSQNTKITSIWNNLPHSWEAGTLNIAGIIGWGAAIDYLNTKKNLEKYQYELWNYLQKELQKIDKIKIIQLIKFSGLNLELENNWDNLGNSKAENKKNESKSQFKILKNCSANLEILETRTKKPKFTDYLTENEQKQISNNSPKNPSNSQNLQCQIEINQNNSSKKGENNWQKNWQNDSQNLNSQNQNSHLLKNQNSIQKSNQTLTKKQKTKQELENEYLEQTPILSFFHEDLSSFDLAEILSLSGICLRSGSFCCQPFVGNLRSNSLLRVSLSFYNTKCEIDFFIKKLKLAIKMLE